MDFIKGTYHCHYHLKDKNYIKIELTKEESDFIQSYAESVSELRFGQQKYVGTTKERLRDAFFIGGAGEVAFAKLIGKSVKDCEFSVGGEASDFAHGDLSCFGYECGVKTSKYGLPPLVLRKEEFEKAEARGSGRAGAEVICTVKDEAIEKDENGHITGISEVWINGFATADIIKTYQARELVKFQECEKYKDRAGFYGYEKLLPLNKENFWVFDMFYNKNY